MRREERSRHFQLPPPSRTHTHAIRGFLFLLFSVLGICVHISDIRPRGSFSDNAEDQQALFFTPTSARYMRFVALSAHDGGDSAVVSEIDAILDEN